MDKNEKKRIKGAIKEDKKRAKIQTKINQSLSSPEKIIVEKTPKPSSSVRFAEAVRGILFLVFAVSLIVAVILSQTGYVITTNDIINGLISHIAGRIILAVIAVAFFIYGLKYLRAIK